MAPFPPSPTVVEPMSSPAGSLGMAHDENQNFCGDSLRLGAFLRVVQNIPQRPSRCRRRAPSIAEGSHVENQTPSSAVSTSWEALPSPNEQFQEQSQEKSQEQALEHSTPSFPVKIPAVYASKATKTDPRRCGVSDTRKRRLPTNELALVRSTTEDSLAYRSV